jgi:ATP-dependent DNA helicase PIF1
MEFTPSPKQKRALSILTQGKNILLTGPGGCGKTSVIKYFAKQYKYRFKIGVTSTTGISALLINGTTLHSYLGIGLGKNSAEAMVTTIFKKKYLSERWKSLEILIIDEISMLSPVLFDKLEEIARTVRRNDKPFGGIQLILSGDFCQLPCVDSDKFCFESESWDKCIDEIVYLTDIMRQRDTNFQTCLNEIRLGDISQESTELIESRIGKSLKNEYGIIPTKLYPLNIAVDDINKKALRKLSKKTGILYEYNIECVFNNKKTNEEKYRKFCPAVETLQLTEGCQVMLVHNLDIEMKLINGSRGVVVNFIEDLPLVKFLNGEERIIDYHTWELEENDKKIGRITQVPLRLGYSMSIHKSQGATLDYAIIDLENIFEYGMAYVALSRLKSLEGLSIIGIEWGNVRTHPKAIKFYREI